MVSLAYWAPMCEYKMAPFPFLWSDTIPPWPTHSLFPAAFEQCTTCMTITSSPLWSTGTEHLVGNWRTVNWDLWGSKGCGPWQVQIPAALIHTDSRVFRLIHFSRPSHNAIVSHSDSTPRTASPHKRTLAAMVGQFQGWKGSSSWDPAFCLRPACRGSWGRTGGGDGDSVSFTL